jgi:hypothetical protein
MKGAISLLWVSILSISFVGLLRSSLEWIKPGLLQTLGAY